jgi:hypothetical protein
MHNMLKTKKFFVVCLLALPSAGLAQQRIANGPIEKFESATSQLTVLGQTFTLDDATRFAANGRTLARAQGFKLISLYQSVNVEGKDTALGTTATVVDFATTAYVPGASSVYIRGPLTEYSRDKGEIRIGALRIDATTLAPEIQSELSAGTEVELSGIQPSLSGALVGPIQLSIGGTGLQKRSIGGTGSQLQSIGGTGAQLQSIGGTGMQKQSIGGTGSQLQSIGGTGIQLQSIGGTGLAKQSIGGTGVSSL